MELRERIEGMEVQQVVSLGPGDVPRLLEIGETIRADDTRLAGWIRILSVQDRILVQEETPDGEVLLRRLDSRTSAERLVEGRLADYERMWDGCGCRIDYHG